MSSTKVKRKVREGRVPHLPPINTGKEHFVSCVKCEGLIEGAVYFCPNCGSAVLFNILLNSHTTANYDPTSRLLKPWREEVIVPPRVPARDLTFKNVKEYVFLFSVHTQIKKSLYYCYSGWSMETYNEEYKICKWNKESGPGKETS